MQHQHHASQFKESWTDLGMRVDLEAAVPADDADARAGMEADRAKVVEGRGKKSVFRLYPPVRDGEVKRLYWNRGVLAVGIVVVMVVIVVVVVVGGRR